MTLVCCFLTVVFSAVFLAAGAAWIWLSCTPGFSHPLRPTEIWARVMEAWQ